MILKKFFSPLHAHDVTVICFGIILSLLNALFSRFILEWYILIITNSTASIAIWILAHYDERSSNKPVKTPVDKVFSFVHHWYVAPLIFFTFKELYFMIAPIHGRDYDDLLIAIDRWIFGVDPTVWLAQWSTPLVTEILQIAYSSFYFSLIVVGWELYTREDRSTFFLYAFYIVYGFFLSYLAYFLLPAVGPRFTLHNFDTLNDELPGLLVTSALRDFVNAAESVPLDVSNPIGYVQRDVFPSGHTMMMLVMMYFVVKYRMKTKLFILVAGVLLIIGAVYLRYHYVIDLVAGALFLFLCLWTAPWLYQRWGDAREKLRN